MDRSTNHLDFLESALVVREQALAGVTKSVYNAAMQNPIVVALTGSFGAGCSTVADRLCSSHGFKHYSLGSILRGKATAAGLGDFGKTLTPDQRQTLQDFGDELRSADAAVLVKECIKTMEEKNVGETEGACVVVESIRNPAEITAFRALFPRFLLLAVYASRKVRWERVKVDFDRNEKEFDARDERDRGEGQPEHGQHVQACVDEADIFLGNDVQCDAPSTWDASIWQSVSDIVSLVRNPGSRVPNLDELFMGQAYAASLRSGCNKRRVGAAMVRFDSGNRDQRTGSLGHFLVSTGYNEAPNGVQSCRELGGTAGGYCEKDREIISILRKFNFCPGCGATLAPSDSLTTSLRCRECRSRIVREFSAGRQLDLCRAVHAEEAAILQAAKLGSTSLKGAVLYTTTFPCLLCAKQIVQVGITKMVFAEPYPMPRSMKLLEDARIELQQFQGVTARAYFRLFQ